MFDLNDAQPQFQHHDLIPDGTFVRVRMVIRPGGINGAAPMDAGLLTASKSSDARLLDCEFTVIEGLFVRKKFWQMFTVAGGKLDDKGVSKGWNISKAAFRAMVDSALGLNPSDMSEAARARRTLRGLKDLDGISFVARIMVEPASNPNYSDVNRIAHVVTPDEPEYAAVMRGEPVVPKPVNAKPRKGPEPAAQGGAAWAAPAGQSPAPSWSRPETPVATPMPSAAPAWATQAAPSAPPPGPAPGPAWLNT